MRANPTPASGPVSIKHVRNTVPKKPGEPVTTFVTLGPPPKGYPANIKLEEPTL